MQGQNEIYEGSVWRLADGTRWEDDNPSEAMKEHLIEVPNCLIWPQGGPDGGLYWQLDRVSAARYQLRQMYEAEAISHVVSAVPAHVQTFLDGQAGRLSRKAKTTKAERAKLATIDAMGEWLEACAEHKSRVMKALETAERAADFAPYFEPLPPVPEAVAELVKSL